MSDSLVRFKSLLRELFQLDFADLDFGMYRLFRLRAKEVEAFIEEGIPALVDEAFGHIGGEQAEALRARLEDLKAGVRDELDEEPFGADGSLLDEVNQQKHGKTVRGLLDDYKSAFAEAQSMAVSEDRKVEVFNHLHAFFSRYYDNADFIPLPRYGRSETYAVPYSGEEVAFHWATKGMHYIKSATHFRDYRFSVDGADGQPALVHFRITDANLPTNNTKGDTRYFFPVPEAVDYDTGANTLTLPFHYRLPTAEEAAALGNKNVQAKILEQAVPELLGRVQGVALHLHAVLANPASQADEIPLLTRRLVHFTCRANQDYFIHPDLGGFLGRELEFYLKDVVLSLEDVAGDLKGKLATIQVIRKVGLAITGFLHQVESAQNRLFEKPKFVLASDWLVPIRFVPERFWPEILGNTAQKAAWTGLFGTPESPDTAFLKSHPTVVLDTRHFDPDFTRRLLEALPFDSLDEATDGLLVHSENWQALNLMKHKLAGQVDCIYIDPPYNTGSDEFIYKDRYQHSTWLTMLGERLNAARDVLSSGGVVFASIDEKEYSGLKIIFNQTIGTENYVGELVWKNATDNNPTQIAQEHEYVLCYANAKGCLAPEWKSPLSDAKESILNLWKRSKSQGLTNNQIQRELRQYLRDNASYVGELGRYKHVDDDGPFTGSESVHNPHPGGYDYDILHPETGRPMRKPSNGYRFPWETMKRDYIDRERLIYGPDENRIVKIKLYLDEYQSPLRSVIELDGRLGAYSLNNLFGEQKIFKNPKAVQLIEKLISFVAGESSTVLDFFAGSGTTAQSVIQLNRAAGKNTKFILVDSGEYFAPILVNRVLKVMFTDAWRDGRPNGPVSFQALSEELLPEWVKRSPRLVQVLRVESYEDALQNLHAMGARELTAEGEGAKERAGPGEVDRLAYVYEALLETSSTLLSVDKLANPFNYILEALTPAGPVEKPVDLVETAHWLLGVRVDKLESWDGPDGRPYRVTLGRIGEAKALIVWRDLDGLDPAADRAFIKERSAGFGRVLVNGDCGLPGAESLDALLFERFRGPAH